MEPSSSPRSTLAIRRFTRHLADPLYGPGYLLMLGGGTTAVLGFVFWIVAARSYPAHVVGINSAAISAMMFVSGVGQLGLPSVLVRYVPTAGDGARALVVGSYAVTAGLSLALGAGAALTSRTWSPRLSFLADDPAWLIGFALATMAWTVFTLQDGVLTGLHAARWVPIENSLFSAAKLAGLVALAGVAPFAGLFLAWNVPVAFAVLGITVLILGRLLPRGRGQTIATALDRGRLIGLATGNYLAQLFGIALTFLMPVIVADATDAATTAYFYAPWTIAAAMQLLASNTASSLTVQAALEEPRLAQLSRRTLTHTMRLLVPVTVALLLAAPYVLRAYGAQYAHAGVSLLRLLALGAIPNAVVTLGLAVARVRQRGRTVLAIQAAEGTSLLALSAILLQRDGIEGVGVAYLASQSAVALWLAGTSLRPLLLQGRT